MTTVRTIIKILAVLWTVLAVTIVGGVFVPLARSLLWEAI